MYLIFHNLIHKWHLQCFRLSLVINIQSSGLFPCSNENNNSPDPRISPSAISAGRTCAHLNEPHSAHNKASLVSISWNNARHNQTPLTNATAGIGIEIYARLNNTTISICQISQATISPLRARACSWFVYKTNLMYAFNTYLTYATH